jgi:hypothetical protein
MFLPWQTVHEDHWHIHWNESLMRKTWFIQDTFNVNHIKALTDFVQRPGNYPSFFCSSSCPAKCQVNAPGRQCPGTRLCRYYCTGTRLCRYYCTGHFKHARKFRSVVISAAMIPITERMKQELKSVDVCMYHMWLWASSKVTRRNHHITSLRSLLVLQLLVSVAAEWLWTFNCCLRLIFSVFETSTFAKLRAD